MTLLNFGLLMIFTMAGLIPLWYGMTILQRWYLDIIYKDLFNI